VLSTVLGRFPTTEEYKTAVDGIDLTKFTPPEQAMTTHFDAAIPVQRVD